MPDIHLIAVTARTAAVRFVPDGTRYWLDRPAGWRLTAVGEASAREGVARTTVVLLHDLMPATSYRLLIEGAGVLAFSTPPCAGLVRVTDFGADPHVPDAASAFRDAIAAAPDGGTVLVPAGRFTTGPVFLKTGVTLHLADGAVLAARADRDNWPILPARRADGRMLGSWEGLPAACHAGVVTAVGAERIAITGPGTIDGGGDRGDWWTWAKATRNGARRPRLLHLIDCRDVVLLGPTVRNAPSWTIHPQGCRTVVAAGLTIEAPHDSPNTDGFNPESCEGVRIEGVRFSVGDDCIAIKAGKRGPNGEDDHLAPTRDVVVRHCLMERGHGGVVIGSEMSGGVDGVTVEACEMVGTDRGLRLKTRRGRGGTVSRIAMRNVSMRGVLVPFSANAFYHCDPDGHAAWVQSREPAAVGPGTPMIDGVTIDDITIDGLGIALGAFLGLPEAPIRGVSISRVRLSSTDEAAVPAPPIMADRVPAMVHEGICAAFADVRVDDPDLLSDQPLTIED